MSEPLAPQLNVLWAPAPPGPARKAPLVVASVIALIVGIALGIASGTAATRTEITTLEESLADSEAELDDSNTALSDAEDVVVECQSVEEDLRAATHGLDDAYAEALNLVAVAVQGGDFQTQATTTDAAYNDAKDSYTVIGECG